MQIQTYYPNNHLLARHIAYFYYVISKNADFSASYYAFPHVYNGLSIYRSANYQATANSVTTYSDNKKNHGAFLQSRYQFPLKVTLNGPVDQVTIVFKPLGINHFMDAHFGDLAKHVSQPFDQWQGRNYNIFLNKFFATNNFEQRTALIETFLLTVYKPFSDYVIMKEAVDLISDLDSKFEAAQMAAALNVSVRTLNRLFIKHLGLSPVAYRKSLQFRHSLKNKLYNEQFKRLTDICYESNFYDASYFNRIYKQFTGSNPARFFKAVDNKGDNMPLFQYLYH